MLTQSFMKGHQKSHWTIGQSWQISVHRVTVRNDGNLGRTRKWISEDPQKDAAAKASANRKSVALCSDHSQKIKHDTSTSTSWSLTSPPRSGWPLPKQEVFLPNTMIANELFVKSSSLQSVMKNFVIWAGEKGGTTHSLCADLNTLTRCFQ